MDSRLQQAKEQIERFDDCRTPLVVITMIGRVGSQLLQSYLDNHPQLLMLPSTLFYYIEWQQMAHLTGEALVDAFMGASFKQRVPYSHHYLGSDRNEPADFDLAAYRAILLELLEGLETVNRKTFLLAIHYAYGVLHNQDLAGIRAVVLHHHMPLSVYFRKVTVERDITLRPMVDGELQAVLADFPHCRWITCLRNFYDLYEKIWTTPPPEHLRNFYRRLYTMLFGIYHALTVETLVGKARYRFLRLEDFHRQHEAVMSDLRDFIGIDDDPMLQVSTVTGKLWWGTDPRERPLYGINPEFKDDSWVGKLDAESMAFCDQVLAPLNRYFGYPIAGHESADINLTWRWIPLERYAHGYAVRAYLKHPVAQFTSFFAWLALYPVIRVRFINRFKQAGLALETLQPGQWMPKAFWLTRNRQWMADYRRTYDKIHAEEKTV